MSLTIWSNAILTENTKALLQEQLRNHRLILSHVTQAAGRDLALAQADIALGQPDPDQLLELPNVRWVHLTTAGYTPYERDDLRRAFKSRAAILTNSSGVYAEPCAQHALAMMLALARRLPDSMRNQAAAHAWPTKEIRAESRLLVGQTALLVGLGAIGHRLIELLSPLRMKLIGVRRKPTGNEPIPTHPIELLGAVLPQADHVINILPGSSSTEHLFNAQRFATMKRGAIFYNIGRGSTVDQYALQAALQTQHLSAAYLDVTSPEPLPPEHPLWALPNCHITPHTAGGHLDEFERLVQHFLHNLSLFEKGEPLVDLVF